MPITETRTSFKAVYIPCDDKLPVVEVTVPITKGDEISAMTDFVKAHLAKYDAQRLSTMDEASKKAEVDNIGEQIKKMIAEQPQLKGLQLTEEMIQQVYSSNSVDNVPLLLNKKENDYIAVTLYCDDQGIAKKLPLNTRATSLTVAVKKPTQVMGDAFIASCFDNDDDFLRRDFTFEDLDVNRPWAQKAIKANEDFARRAGGKAPASGITTKAIAPAGKASGAASTGNGKVCGDGNLGCSRAAPLRCGACKAVYYCSKDHQTFDWKRHKAECQAKKGTA